MKKVAAGFGGKSAAMMLPAKAEKLTGYRVGGISPFGQKRAVPTLFEAMPMTAAKVWINAGARGLLLGIAPADALKASGGRALDIVS
jgi:Cys-tRNA(Pro)/Cys-tRNA(Cys) deacylase